MDNNYWQTGMDAVELIRCALHGKQPAEPENSNLEDIYRFCEFHSVTATAATALEMLWKDNPPQDQETAGKFRQALARSMRKSILLNAEREQILQHLEQIGCWYMPLKGSLLQHDYPRFGMRQMSDNDILIDASMQEAVHSFLTGLGYEAVSYQITVENNYHKPPVYNFEMHTALFGMEAPAEFRTYYADVKQRLIPDEGRQYGYHFRPEDFYIYMIAHAWKHASKSGIGIRFLADLWVWNRKHGAALNRDYVASELKKLGAAEFEQSSRQLSGKLLDGPGAELSQQEREILVRFFEAGTYGTPEQKMDNQLNGKTGGAAKLRYVLSRVFPSAQTLSVVHPHVMEQKWRVPLIWIWRLIRAVFVTPVSTIRELAMLIRKKR